MKYIQISALSVVLEKKGLNLLNDKVNVLDDLDIKKGSFLFNEEDDELDDETLNSMLNDDDEDDFDGLSTQMIFDFKYEFKVIHLNAYRVLSLEERHIKSIPFLFIRFDSSRESIVIPFTITEYYSAIASTKGIETLILQEDKIKEILEVLNKKDKPE